MRLLLISILVLFVAGCGVHTPPWDTYELAKLQGVNSVPVAYWEIP